MRAAIKKHPLGMLSVTLVAGLIIGGVVGGSSETSEPVASTTTQSEPTEVVAEDPPPDLEPNPDAEYDLTCDYLLGDPDYSFVAGGDVTNTGNIGVVAEVKVSWTLLGSDPVTTTKSIRLKPGKTKDVQISLPASMDQIDAHQSADGDCDVTAAMVDTFGDVE